MSRIIDASKGRITETATSFGKHYTLFQALEIELKKRNDNSLKCLVIGPGLDSPLLPPDKDNPFPGRDKTAEKYINSYQVYELANSIRRAGFNDYSINALDIDPEVLDEMKKTPSLIRIYRNFWERSPYVEQAEEKSKMYFGSFFNDCVISSDNSCKIVQIPREVTSKINLNLGDVIQDEIPPESYDVVICTVVLSHYTRDVTRDSINRVPEVMEKLRNAVRPNGYLIDSQLDYESGWELIEFCRGDMATVHSQSAELLLKNKI